MRTMSLLLAFLVLVPTPGCVAVVAAAAAATTVGYIKWEANQASRDFEHGFANTWKASLKGLEAVGYTIPAGTIPTRTEGTVKSGTARVEVALYPEGFTRVRVSVGTFDTAENRRKAGLIMKAVAGELGEE